MLNSSPEKAKGKPEPVDIHVGRRIRMRRVWIQVTQVALAEAIGVTFQQLQKYEKGTNRVGASRLQQIADALDAPVSYFFADMPGAAAVGGDDRSGQKKLQPEIMEFASSDEGLALIRAFSRITDERVRSRTLGLVKALAEQDPS
ncbi:helix-turn-helix transcriptional regulator (plasmid) [Sinorhizobium numidicum]|uniref:Helix-turn-helix transcriptional regulator n=1 Tax=Sinorhizobium numidicum TaxID=680248 RepID=A0ABY8D4H8_9HYPH|nr:helix-turn-helix transcriptional regulator [Sinorhizobium numidicum]WEX79332.1 helix-turn-helix transcriptional regulator [Sinorhizobium numidicum]WEX85297.1 helix-turn-helix transcriptional regulator [Sinorhizobium numidicum]